MEGGFADQYGQSDGDDYHAQRRGIGDPPDEKEFDEKPDARGDDDRGGDGRREGKERVECYRNHTTEHNKFALREIDYAGGIVDDVESDCDNRVYASDGNTRQKILQNVFKGH
jgi:hypothetical protein